MALAIGAIEPHRLYFCKTLPLLPKPFCRFYLFYYYSPLTLPSRTCQRFSSESNSGVDDFPCKNAYDVLGVSESSSLAEIKASFLKLAKETHPDVADASDSTAPQRFVQILAAYEVKHMHWYQAGDEVSPCECRCSRARLPSSKFWLFEPRCSMHDIGGWYVETFGRDRKGRTIPSQRQWDGTYPTDYSEKRLHPAMYLLALAYRTLDLEDAKRRKHTVRDILEPKLFTLLQWCKKLL